jgi:hypothetical protein
MDANESNETRQRRREEALVRRLGEAFDRLGPPGTGDCPDSEQLAAYHEQLLGIEETSRCEAHFDACSRCRKILAVLGASAEAPLGDQEVARLGELASAAQGQPQREQTAKPERDGVFPWRLRWLVPAFGAAAAVVLWLAVRPPWRPAEQASKQVLIAEGAKPLSSSGGEKATPVENPAAVTSNAVAKSAAVTPKAKETEAPKGLKQEPLSKDNLVALDKAEKERFARGDRQVSGTLDASLTRDAEADKKSERRDLSSSTGGLVASGAPSPAQPAAPAPAAPLTPPVAAPSAQAQAQALQGIAPTSRAEANPRQKAALAPAPRSAAADKISLANAAPIISLSRMSRNFSLMLESPSSGKKWRISNEGRLERSDDGGKTWTLQSLAGGGDWIAGAAVTEKVWWLAGANGAIARTTDGDHWERIAPPASAADSSGKQPDWLDVQAIDAQTATIFAGDQQRYSTRDGGKTWQKQ